MNATAELQPYANDYEHLRDELQALDLMIRLRLGSFLAQNRPPEADQVARTVYISQAEVEWLLDRSEEARTEDSAAGELRATLAQLRTHIAAREACSLEAGKPPALVRLARIFNLSALERMAVVVCIAPEMCRKYDRIYAYLQDDILRKKPSVDLALDFLCGSEEEKWEARLSFSDSSILIRAGILRKTADPHSVSGSSGLAEFLDIDPRIRQFLAGGGHMDARLAGLARLSRPPQDAGAGFDRALAEELENLVGHYAAAQGSARLVIHVHGTGGAGNRELVFAVCRRMKSLAITIDAELLLARGVEAEGLLRLAFREGLLQAALVHSENSQALLDDSARVLLKAMETAVDEFGGILVLSGSAPWTRKNAFADCIFHAAEVRTPGLAERVVAWERYLTGLVRGEDAAHWAQMLGTHFRLTPGEIRAAVEMAQVRRFTEAEPPELSLKALAAACRSRSNKKLGELSLKVSPQYGWADLVLPVDRVTHLKELCDQARHKYRVYHGWGFDKKVAYGRGLSALFTGPSGTGKTMAAQVIARELELDLYKVDLAGVVSKYIGETEKNLSRIFAEAETSNAILFFDEADALFGKRTEVSDAHDRYANIETSFLLQKMEEYDGIVILATNLRDNMDEAFTRRIRFAIEFPFPDEQQRLRIWRAHLPAEVPGALECDYEYLARELQLAGGNIRNVVLNSVFLAAAEGGALRMEHLMRAAQREFEKMGKLWSEQRTQRWPRQDAVNQRSKENGHVRVAK